jgi:hypothetical protein
MAERPTLITVGMYVSLVIFVIVAVELLLAEFGVIEPKVGGRAVSLAEFFRVGWSGIVPCVWLGLVAYAFWKHKRWGRQVALAFWALLLGGVSVSLEWKDVRLVEIGIFGIYGLAFVGGSAAYFFGSKQAVAYYASLPTR